jgi:hypothetical protein
MQGVVAGVMLQIRDNGCTMVAQANREGGGGRGIA